MRGYEQTELAKQKSLSFGQFVARTLSVVTLLAGIVAILYGIGRYVDSRVAATVQTTAFINDLSRRLRPMLILDGHGSILADMGASDLFESITVTNDPGLGTDTVAMQIGIVPMQPHELPNRIVLTPKRHMPFPPLVEPLNPVQGFFDSRRGVGHQWIYEIRGGYAFLEMSNTPPVRFRIEVIQQ